MCYNKYMSNSEFTDIRPSPIAGTWYPADPIDLRDEIQDYLDRAVAPELTGEVFALVVPHAGHIYSGFTAAYAFKSLLGQNFQRVILLAPSHQPYSHPLITSDHQAYSTPLGLVPVDQAALEALTQLLEDSAGISITPVRHDREHSLEIELPFLQVALPQGFTLVPLMLANQSHKLVSALAEVIVTYLQGRPAEEKTLLVASSDLSHFYSEKQANQLDSRVLQALKAMDDVALYRLNTTGTGQACGLGPIATVLLVSRQLGADQLSIADYRTSAAVTHDTGSVVGYGSAVITRPA